MCIPAKISFMLSFISESLFEFLSMVSLVSSMYFNLSTTSVSASNTQRQKHYSIKFTTKNISYFILKKQSPYQFVLSVMKQTLWKHDHSEWSVARAECWSQQRPETEKRLTVVCENYRYHGFKSCETYLLSSLGRGECGEWGDVCIINVFHNVVVDIGSTYCSLNKAVGITLFQFPGGEWYRYKDNYVLLPSLGLIQRLKSRLLKTRSYFYLRNDYIYTMMWILFSY